PYIAQKTRAARPTAEPCSLRAANLRYAHHLLHTSAAPRAHPIFCQINAARRGPPAQLRKGSVPRAFAEARGAVGKASALRSKPVRDPANQFAQITAASLPHTSMHAVFCWPSFVEPVALGHMNPMCFRAHPQVVADERLPAVQKRLVLSLLIEIL